MGHIEDEIEEIEQEIAETPYNKSTEQHIGRLKAKLAKLRDKKEKREKQSGGGGGTGYDVKKSGHASVGLVGFPSVGKSTLLNQLTNADSEVGAYEFTTLEVVPGMMEHNHANIQVLDLPGLIHGASANRGRGREVISVARNCDLIVLVVDPWNPDQLDVIVDELYDAGIRLNTSPPDVRVNTDRRQGGLSVSFTVDPTHVDEDLAESILDEWGYVNANLVVREDVTPDELVDALAGNRVYQPAIVALNKVDAAEDDLVERRLEEIREEGWTAVPISAHEAENLEALKDHVYEAMDLIRIYLKPQGGDADMEEPLVVRRGATVGDVCDHLHREMRNRFRYAQVTGPSSKFPDQRVGLDHDLQDGDVLTLITRD
jgi:small GTP-binding protein